MSTESYKKERVVNPNPNRHFSRKKNHYNKIFFYYKVSCLWKLKGFILLKAYECKYEQKHRHKSAEHSNKGSNSRSTSRPKTSNSQVRKNSKAAEKPDLLDYLKAVGNRTTGLTSIKHKKLPIEYRNSHNLTHSDLKKDQRIYLNSLCHCYSVHHLKQLKQFQYLSLLQKQKDLGKRRYLLINI
jgi:hypothetical protein